MNNSSMTMVSVYSAGCISALGAGLDATEAALYSDTPHLPAQVDRFQTALNLPVFAAPGPVPDESVPGGYTMQLLRAALDEAMERGGLTAAGLQKARVGVCIGTTVACQLNNIPFYSELRSGNTPPAEPFRNYILGNPAEWIRNHYGLNGPALTVSNACASGTDAIGIGMLWIEAGLCDMVIAGGCDELNKVPYDGFNALGVCSGTPCRPFDASRDGLNLGEGAGVVILGKESVKAQFAVAGFGKSADAYHITQPALDGNGLERAIRTALGTLPPDRIAFINAHGTGTPTNDKVEADVLARVFGPDVRFMSTKPLTGHTLGAAGAIEFILSMLMLKNGKAVRSVRFAEKPADMPCMPLTADLMIPDAEYALSTSLAFGGSNSAVVIARRGA